ncbi:hypothetical protein EUA93_18610 [Nocardioides oleivorans]|uniref:Uncharacterized protein n=1 Tax=Nocardioides oleivorans TaxID=273676 RepID=A0A4Q2RPT1_9ACTN|nr:hypothetical protein [Nocardioides oleivorans]RYB90951.1 hypothetical protein EUA93_18610 [Nocardioides oleivorans]
MLGESIGPVLRDLAHAGLVAPRFADDDWAGADDRASCMMWGADGSGSGLAVARGAALAERVADAADQVQEWVIEDQLWGSGRTNWPPCPSHPDNHPLQAAVVGAGAVWTCPADRSVVRPVGEP